MGRACAAVERLESRRLLSFGPDAPFDAALRNHVLGFSTGVQQFLENAHRMIFEQSFATKLPLVGDALKGMKDGPRDYIRLAITELGKFNTDLSGLTAAQSAAQFQQALAGLSYLNQYAPQVLVSEQGTQQSAAESGEAPKVISWKTNINIKGEALGPNALLPFDLGLPVFDLQLKGSLKASLQYDFNLPLVIDTTGVWFETANADEFKMTLTVTAPNTSFAGTLGFLKVSATDAGSQLVGNLKIDLQDRVTDSDTRLYLSEIPAALPKILKKVELDGAAKLYMNFALDPSLPGLPQQFHESGAPTMPRITTEFRLDWGLPQVNITNGNLTVNNLGASPTVKLNNVAIDLGTWANNLIVPMLRRINGLLTPARQMFDFFDQPVDFFNEIAPQSIKDAWGNGVVADEGGPKISLLEAVKGMTEALFPDANAQQRKDLSNLLLARSVIRSIEGASNTFNPTYDSFRFVLGSFTFGQHVDVRSLLPESLRNPGTPLSNYGSATLNPADLPNAFKQLKDTLSGSNFGGGQGDAGFKFPIVEQPLSVFGLLLGRPVDLVTYTTPRVTREFTFNVEWPLPPLPVAKLALFGGVAFDLQFRFGYDTWGFQTFANGGFRADEIWKLLDGFYVADTNASGVDVPEFEVRGNIGAGIKLDGAIVSLGVGGGLRGILNVDIDDPNDDGKLRPTEIVAVVQHNPLCLFRLDGELTASLNVFGNVGPLPFNFPLAKATIAEFELACLPASGPAPAPDLTASDFTLRSISGGPASALRAVSVTVTNAGDAAAPASTGRLVVSDDDALDASDLQVTDLAIPALAPGESATLTAQVHLPRLPFATDNAYAVGFIADIGNVVAESDETNNAAPDALAPTRYAVESALPLEFSGVPGNAELNVVNLSDGADLRASLADELIGSRDIDLYRVALTANGLPVGIDINSSLNTDTYVRVYDAAWNLVAQNDDGLAPSDNPGFLPSPNKSAYVQFVPPASGVYYVAVSGAWSAASDPRLLTGRNAAPGGDEALSRDYRIRFLADPFALPDLRVTSLIASGGFNFITATVANEGQAPANWTDVRFYLSDDAEITVADVLLATDNTFNFADPLGRLLPGQSKTINIDLTLVGGFLANADPFLSDNAYFLGAFVDANQWINEAGEANNSGQGLGVDQLFVRTEVDLNAIGDGTVNARPLAVGAAAQTGTLGDELIRRRDSDIYAFTVDQPGRILRVAVDGLFQSPGVRFDPYLSVYDAAWRLVGRADATAGNTFNIAFDTIYAAAGTHYAVVSFVDNGETDPRLLAPRAEGGAGLWDFQIRVFNPFPVRVPGDTYEDLSIGSLVSDDPAASQQTLTYYLSAIDGAPNSFVPLDGRVAVAAYLTGGATDLEIARQFFDAFPTTGGFSAAFVSMAVTIPQGLAINGNAYGIRVTVNPEGTVFENGFGGDLTFNNSASIPLAWDADLAPGNGGGVVPRPLTGFAGGAIGDEPSGRFDQDIFAIDLARGQAYTALLGTEDFGAAVRVFDDAWNPVAAAIVESGAGNAQVAFVARRSGVHYIVASARGNAAGDPRLLSDRSAGSGTGAYNLSLFGAFGTDARNFIGGYAFDDVDNDGVFDPGEAPVTGALVWLDLDNDGVKDLDEPVDITDDLGAYLFEQLPVSITSTAYVARVQSLTGLGPRSAADAARGVTLSRFGADGAAAVDFGNVDTIRGSVVQPDGRIVAVGSWDGGASDFAIARYNRDGSLDSSFGGGFAWGPGSGRAHYAFSDFFGGVEFATAVALQPDGKIVVVGYTNLVNGVGAVGGNDIAVLRLEPDGALDAGFGVGGRFTLDLGADERATSVGLDAFGGIVIAGYRDDGANADMLLLKLTANGQLDPFFGSSVPAGVVIYDAGGRDLAQDLHVDTAGRIVVAGYSSAGVGDDFVIARFTFSGATDAGFGAGGRTFIDLGYNDRAFALAYDAGWDRYVLVGEADGGLPDFGIAAVSADGILDVSFAGAGFRLLTFGATTFGLFEGARDVLLAPDGGYYVVGYTTATPDGLDGTPGANNLAVARFTPTGDLDPAFDGDGRRVTDRGGDDEQFFTVAGDFRGIFGLGVSSGDFVATLLAFGDSGPWASADGVDFALRGLGGIDGFVSFDADDDGWDADDPRLAGVGVHLDLNGDGEIQEDEPVAFSDADGYYLFAGLIEGTYVMRFLEMDKLAAIGRGDVPRNVLRGLTNRWAQPFTDRRHIGVIAPSFPNAHAIQIGGGQLEELTHANVEVVNRTTGAALPASQIVLTPELFAAPSTARALAISFANTGNPFGDHLLPDGDYLLVITGVDGEQVFRQPFFVLAGDANGDRVVDVADLGVLATHWQQSGRTFAEGDFNYDGVVDVADLGVLATLWQQTLPAPAESIAPASPSRAADAARFSRRRIGAELLSSRPSDG